MGKKKKVEIPFEPPKWLVNMVSLRVQALQETTGGVGNLSARTGAQVIFLLLTEPEPSASLEDRLKWEHTCDNCGEYCPKTLISGRVGLLLEDTEVVVGWGCCPKCKEMP